MVYSVSDKGDLLFRFTEQLQAVLRNDHLNKTGYNSKTISQVRFCEKILIIENFNY